MTRKVFPFYGSVRKTSLMHVTMEIVDCRVKDKQIHPYSAVESCLGAGGLRYTVKAPLLKIVGRKRTRLALQV